MKLQKQLSQKSSRKEYHKYVIVIPNETIKELGWGDNVNLIFSTTSKKFLLIGPATKS